MSKYIVEEISGKKIWDEFIFQSKNKNFYAFSNYLSLEKNINHRYYLNKILNYFIK